MPNRTLNEIELGQASALLHEINARLDALSHGDPDLLFAFRRKVAKQLVYAERSSPMARRKLKIQKRKQQDGRCAICAETLPAKYTVLDRFEAARGYTSENTQLICEPCDRSTQTQRGYA
jgi:hypothetical protein